MGSWTNKDYFIDMWTYIWSKTTVDDIIMAKAEEVKSKAKEIKKIIKK